MLVASKLDSFPHRGAHGGDGGRVVGRRSVVPPGAAPQRIAVVVAQLDKDAVHLDRARQQVAVVGVAVPVRIHDRAGDPQLQSLLQDDAVVLQVDGSRSKCTAHPSGCTAHGQNEQLAAPTPGTTLAAGSRGGLCVFREILGWIDPTRRRRRHKQPGDGRHRTVCAFPAETDYLLAAQVRLAVASGSDPIAFGSVEYFSSTECITTA